MYRKVLFLLLIVAAVALSREARAQRILGAISAGANISQLDGDEYYGFRKAGVTIGPSVRIPFGKNKNWSVGMELLYSQKGSYHNGETDTTTYRIQLDYVEIPVLVRFTDKKVISGGVGLCYGQLINIKETPMYYATPHSEFSKSDFSILGEVSFRLWFRLWIDVRYQYSLLNLRTVTYTYPTPPYDSWDRDQYNNTITLRLTWIFNQQARTKKDKQGTSVTAE
jgi:hypothetical protein